MRPTRNFDIVGTMLVTEARFENRFILKQNITDCILDTSKKMASQLLLDSSEKCFKYLRFNNGIFF